MPSFIETFKRTDAPTKALLASVTLLLLVMPLANAMVAHEILRKSSSGLAWAAGVGVGCFIAFNLGGFLSSIWANAKLIIEQDEKLVAEERVREETLARKRADKRAQDEADQVAAYQSAIRNFCCSRGGEKLWGRNFRDWKLELDDLVNQGLSLVNPNPDFDALLASVRRSVDYNQEAASMANNPALDDRVRASFAIGIPFCLHASQACLQHLLDIQNGWYEKATVAAAGSSKPKGRL